MERLESEVGRSQRQYDGKFSSLLFYMTNILKKSKFSSFLHKIKDRTSELERTLSSQMDRSKASIEDDFRKQSQELKNKVERNEAAKQRLEQVEFDLSFSLLF